MTTRTFKQLIPLNADHFYAITDTAHFEEFNGTQMDQKKIRIVEEREDANSIYRTLSIQPKSKPMPAILSKLVGSDPDLSYIQMQVKSKTKRELVFKNEAGIMKDYIHINGVISVEPVDENSCYKVIQITYNFTGPLSWFSSRLEKNVSAEQQKSMDMMPSIVTAYLQHLKENGMYITSNGAVKITPLPASVAPSSESNATSRSTCPSSVSPMLDSTSTTKATAVAAAAQ
ncbi:hypothetical protein SAMD00019534_026560 [Acytostelium subglobosum LB1]|uniref:hypothetical protein n=1 Tax=Acytostelium subglobosum LB1 TaxID=1410327 RepID=UPI0006450863|nr:hypothetical protein SAMD00019534_026560 [Acytostelium subglobosum LB1]GAM19481.1 hypothetical protein SAMD00019534_026560 [Acytostelium subglobosum LB1]|eukprot:XP_012757408.1 hypothetical protein SAMD00019534_026560 [Acytostelium subglobosum LB1]